ncbi:MAG: hypothetical protein RMI89_01575 [Gloeomargarita sp. SKYBB_i_bin120]|nr:hypothetical protein [Gloeomargarita sp. SKYG98]MCS7291652.1 hypothetical protein [Gloeomargarita sp. SKYB120]MDW8177211.1 hypothetical protein [Gloeomargarita sp. SKYBB_i_bin120]
MPPTECWGWPQAQTNYEFICKPIDAEELRARIRAALQVRRLTRLYS